jgi:hypothetical protein
MMCWLKMWSSAAWSVRDMHRTKFPAGSPDVVDCQCQHHLFYSSECWQLMLNKIFSFDHYFPRIGSLHAV